MSLKKKINKLLKIHINSSYPLLFIPLILITFGCANHNNVSTIQYISKTSPFDTLLFNHLFVKGDVWQDGQTLSTKRYESIRMMAESGYLPASLVLDLYDIKNGDAKTGNRQAESRLKDMANKGNPVMQCLFVEYWNLGNLSNDEKLVWQKYLTSAADAKIPYCMELQSIYLEKLDLNKQLSLEANAAQLGDLRAQSRMAYRYYKPEGVEKDLRKAYCWSEEYKKTAQKSWATSSSYKDIQFFYFQELSKNPSLSITDKFCSSFISSSY